MSDFKHRVRPDWPLILDLVLNQSRELGPRGVVAFDLDSTVFDNRPRQARIVREYGKAKGLPALEGCTPEHFDSGWDLRGALRKCGLAEAEVERLYPDYKRFWEERFFTSEYCAQDVAVRGAPAYLKALAATKVRVIYVTGRHEGMREGTLAAMRREGFPVPHDNVALLMKPSRDVDDDVFKRTAHGELRKIGALIAAFDNEPIHANDYRSTFPQAVVVHLATDHSGRTLDLHEEVQSIPHFDRP